MKKAVIETGGQQYLVTEGEQLLVDLIGDAKDLTLEPLLIFDDKKVTVGDPTVKGGKVKLAVDKEPVKGQKLKVIRYKAKKRVHKVTGHRQKYQQVKVTSIS